MSGQAKLPDPPCKGAGLHTREWSLFRLQSLPPHVMGCADLPLEAVIGATIYCLGGRTELRYLGALLKRAQTKKHATGACHDAESYKVCIYDSRAMQPALTVRSYLLAW